MNCTDVKMMSGKTIELLSLPRELQLQVLRCTFAADFENLVVSCKALHSLAASTLIQRHNDMRRRYRVLRFPAWDTPAESLAYHWGDTVVEALHRIACEPVIASYVVHVDLGGAAIVGSHPPSIFKRGDTGEPTEAEESLRRFLQASSCLCQLDSSPEFIDEWLQRIIKPRRLPNATDNQAVDHAGAFLLSLLPNVETMALGRQWSLNGHLDRNVDEIRDAIMDSIADAGAGAKVDSIVPQAWHPHRGCALDYVSKSASRLIEMLVARANDETLAGQALSKLRVMYPARYLYGSERNRLSAVVPFLALRTLQEFHHASVRCHMVSNLDEAEDDGGHPDSAAYSFRKLEIANEAAHANDLQGLEDEDVDEEEDKDSEYVPDSEEEDDDSSEDEQLGQCAEPRRKRQPVAHFDDHGRCFDSRYPTLGSNLKLLNLDKCIINPNACRALLRDMRSLKSLRIQYSTYYNFDLPWSVQSCLVVLAEVVGPVLETLKLFASEYGRIGDVIRLSMHSFTALKHLELDTYLFVSVLCDDPLEPLVYVLPPCLETFVLCVRPGHQDALPQLFESFITERAEKLPALRSVTLYIEPSYPWRWGRGPVRVLTEAVYKFASEYGFNVDAEQLTDE